MSTTDYFIFVIIRLLVLGTFVYEKMVTTDSYRLGIFPKTKKTKAEKPKHTQHCNLFTDIIGIKNGGWRMKKFGLYMI